MAPALRWLKPTVFAASLLPLAGLAWQAGAGHLGVNPIETVNRTLGDWALRFLLVALAVTPVRHLSGWAAVARLRCMLGLFAFAYAVLHVCSYVGLDLFFDWHALWKDVTKRTYITVGMAALALLVPLAATSTDAMIRRLGGRRWRRLHQLVYVISPLAVLHFWMMTKLGWSRPALYGAVALLLLGWRLRRAVGSLRRTAAGGGG